MVSPLWKACSEGNLEKAVELLKDATPVDIEVKDHTGVTPLIEAVKNGHVEIVRVLLDKGADPTNASSQGPPESYTSDPVIHGLISVAKGKMAQASAQQQQQQQQQQQEAAYPQDQPAESANMDPAAGYYPPPPPGAYYYPPMPVPPMMPDGTMPYYAPPPMPADQSQPGFGNLPPPEIARMIPCRYYPACRYGASCMFAHPQAPYMQGPPPPAQYPAPYDPMNPGAYPPPTYYPVPPASYGTSPNEMMSPVQAPFSPVNGQPPMPYGVASPVSPTYGHPAPVPMPGSAPPLSPLQTHPAGAQSPPPQGMYPPISPNAQGMVPPYAIPVPYAPQGMPPNGEGADVISPKSPVQGHPQAEAYGPGPMNRDAMSHHRRGSARRPSFGGRGGKPPCLFFPSGRCRNGDDCRFPHVLPDGPVGHHHPPHFAPRGGHRPRPPFHANGIAALEDKFAAMSTQDDKPPVQSRNGTGTNTSDSSRSQSAEPGHKGRGPNFKSNHFANGGPRQDRKFAPPKPQRVPNADEFPVLGGSSPSSRVPSANGSVTPGYSGPTAAQVLQAPPPPKKDAQPTRGNTPDQAPPASATPKESKPEANGAISSPPADQPVNKLPLSFAAAATAAVPEAVKEVSVSA